MTERTLVTCRVWNDNLYDFSGTFKEKPIKIVAGKFLDMDPFEGNDFVSQYSPIVKGADGQPLPSSYKKLRKEFIYSDSAPQSPTIESKKNKCNCCGHTASNKADLEAHIKAQHADVAKPEKA
jgi:hypothetical protein